MAWRVTIHEQEDGTSRNPERRTKKGSSWENFQPIRNGFSSLGTNDKKKDSQKLSLKRYGLEALKEERLKVGFLRTTHNGKSAKGF